MSVAPETRPSLLVRLRDPADAPAWRQFVEVYAPLIHGFLRRQGLQDADAADVAQEVLHKVQHAIRRLEYDPRRGSFRGWLFTIVRNEWRDFLAKSGRGVQGSGDSATHQLLAQHPALPSDLDALWEHEYRQRLFTWAARQVRETVEEPTWQAFWLTSVEGKTAAVAAVELGLSLTAVYVARSRVLSRLRDQVRRLEEAEINLKDNNDG